MILDNDSLFCHAKCFPHGNEWVFRVMQYVHNGDDIDRVICMGKMETIISDDRDVRLRPDLDVHPLKLQIRAEVKQKPGKLAITTAYIQNRRLLRNQRSKVTGQRFNATSMNVLCMNRRNQAHESPN